MKDICGFGVLKPGRRKRGAKSDACGGRDADGGARGAPCVPQLGGGVLRGGEEPLDVTLEADGRDVALVPLILNHLRQDRGEGGPHAP